MKNFLYQDVHELLFFPAGKTGEVGFQVRGSQGEVVADGLMRSGITHLVAEGMNQDLFLVGSQSLELAEEEGKI
jgi:hypothetical protein